ncbi:MAG: PAS domain S-box protein [Leptolyngbya sp. SIOISBB]|nr:PAS domain S-box protein [Leptolyngbya sp. SIOISBB]
MHPDDRERVATAWYESTVPQQAGFQVECRFRQPSGKIVWIYAQATPLLDAQGTLLGYIGTVTDITERHQAEVALRESEAKFRQLADSIASIFFIHDARTRALLYASPAFETIWGIPCEVLHEHPHVWLDYVHPDDVDWLTAAVEALNFDVLSNAEYRIIRPDGEVRWLASRSFPIMDASGQVYRIAGVAEDISDRKATEAALQTSEERLRTALEAAQMGSWDWNLATDEVIWSASLEKLMGLEPGTFDGDFEIAMNVIHPDDRQRVTDLTTYSVQHGTPCYIEFRVVKANGEIRWLASRGNVFQDAHGQPIRMAGMDMDITDRKQAELSLQRTNALMGAINTAQTQFMTDADPERLFEHLLETLLELTDSEYGLITEVLLTADGETYIDDAYLKTQGYPHQKVSALTDRLEGTAGHNDDEDAVPPENRNLRSLQPLIKQVILTQEPVIANHLAADDQSIHGLGSPAPLRSFLGVPFHRGNQLVGLVGLANRTDGYDPSMFAELALLLNTCQSTIEAYRNETKRRQAEQALLQLNDELEQRVQRRTAALTRSEADLRTIFNNVYDAIFIHDLDGKILDVNDRSLQLFGATREQLLPLSIKELSAPESPISQIPELLNRALNGEALRFEWKIRRYADPVTLDAEVSLRCVELGNRSVIIAGVQNISDRKQAEAALQESRNMLKLVLDAIPQRVFWKDRDSRFLGCNPAFANDFQITAAEILGKTDAELPWAAGAERYRTADVEVMSTGLARVNYEETLINGYGELTWIRTSRVPLTNAQGNVIGVLVCYEDITERKWAEQQLEAERLRLQVALEAAQMGTWESDLETEFWSTQTEAIFGYAPGAFPGDYAAFLNLVHPDDRERVSAFSTQSFAEQGAHTQEYRIQRLDGKLRWVAVQAKVVANEAGTGDRLIGVVQDITDRKQAEAALRDSEARFRQIAENIQEVFWLTTADHEILYVSSAYAQVWGRSPDTVTTDNLLATIFPDDRDRFLNCFRWASNEPSKAILAGEAELEYRIIRPNGDIRWIRDRAFPVTDDQGHIIRIAGVAEDITDRKRLEQEQARLLTILEASPDHIGMATPEGQIIWNNQQGRRIRGLPLNADATQFSMATYHPQWALEVLLNQAIPTAIKEGIWVGETALLDANDEEIPVSQLVLAHKSDTGEIEYLSTIIRDISSLKAAERALRRINEDLEARVIERTADYLAAKDAAEAANRAKSTFFANMSHELRTPLNAILGFSQLMGRDPALSTKHLEELKIINRSGEHLLNLINDILEMSKIEAGQVTLTATNFKLHQMLISLTDMLRLKAEAKNLQFTITLHPQLPRYIRTDGHKLRQVLLNLLSNAIKFTQTGYVVLRVGLSRPKPLTNHDLKFIDSTGGAIRVLNFQVEDSGMGIAAEELDLLFEPFVQTRSGRQSQEGTGLGLPISRQFVDLLGGDFEVTSEPNVGSTFAFEIPVQVMTAEAVELTDKLLRAIALAPDQPTYRILVVEDDWANRVLLQNLLTDLGFVVQTAVNGQAAIERWQAWHPNLIFMDIRMPEMNGYEATQAIRRLEQATQTTTRPTKIICLTAGIFETDQPEFVAIGFDDYICKPIQETIVTQSIARHLGVRYLYAPDLVKAKAIAAAPPLRLTDESLQVLPLDWLQQFQTAITHLSQERMLALIADLSPEHNAIAQLLEEKVHDFDYEVLLNLTQMVLDA